MGRSPPALQRLLASAGDTQTLFFALAVRCGCCCFFLLATPRAAAAPPARTSAPIDTAPLAHHTAQVAYKVPWTAISSLITELSARYGPGVLLRLNLAYFLPSIPVLLLPVPSASAMTYAHPKTTFGVPMLTLTRPAPINAAECCGLQHHQLAACVAFPL